ncbi:MAG: YciI family protein [Actinomycetota bacterium]|nr:YciI family protein [Actinomycetota bacterium]
MKYLILIHSNPDSRARWETLTDEQRMEFGRAHYALHDALLESGDLVASEGLPDPSAATYVSVRDGRIVATDGPFAEAKEYLAGFYLVDVASLDEAVAIAARVPDAGFGSVEVRPVFDRSVLEE